MVLCVGGGKYASLATLRGAGIKVVFGSGSFVCIKDDFLCSSPDVELQNMADAGRFQLSRGPK